MKVTRKITNLPNHKITVNTIYDTSSGFLTAKSADCTLTYESGASRKTKVDFVERKSGLDAVVICAHSTILIDNIPTKCVYLRSSIRPVLSLRDWKETGRDVEETLNCWELPAGLIESHETGIDGVKSAASRECQEEVGADIPSSSWNLLGNEAYSSVGISGERIYFAEAEIDPDLIKVATLDGSAMEVEGSVILVPLKVALNAINDGIIKNALSIIGLQRL